MTADTDRTTRIHISRDMVAEPADLGHRGPLEAFTGLFAAFMAGLVVAVAVQLATPFTDLVFGMLRAATVGAAVVAFIAWSTPRAMDDLVTRVGEGTTRNRNATEDVKHRLTDLCQVVAVGQEQVMAVVQDGARANRDLRRAALQQMDELERLRATVHGLVAHQSEVLAEQTRVLQEVRRRMAEGTADIVAAYETGLKAQRFGPRE